MIGFYMSKEYRIMISGSLSGIDRIYLTVIKVLSMHKLVTNVIASKSQSMIKLDGI